MAIASSCTAPAAPGSRSGVRSAPPRWRISTLTNGLSASGPARSRYAAAASAEKRSSSCEPLSPGSGPGGSPAISPSAVAGTMPSWSMYRSATSRSGATSASPSPSVLTSVTPTSRRPRSGSGTRSTGGKRSSLIVDITVSGTVAVQAAVRVHDRRRLLERPHQRAGERLLQREQLELQLRDDDPGSAAAAQRPEQVRLVLGVDPALLPVRGHDRERAHEGGGEPVAAREPAEAAAERVARDADAGRCAVEAREPVLGRRGHDVAPARAGLHAGGARARVDGHRREPARAEQDGVGEIAERGRAVAGRLRGDAQPVRGGEADRGGEVGGCRGAHDGRRMLVGDQVPGLAGGVPVGSAGFDDVAGDRAAQGAPWGHGPHRTADALSMVG